MKAVIGDHGIDLEGFRYFVGKASSVHFGDYGDKKTPIGPGKLNYLEVWAGLPAPKLAEVRLRTTALQVEFSDRKGLDLLAAVSVPGLASGKVGLKAGDFDGGRVRLVKVSPDGDKPLIDAINASPKVKTQLIEFGGGARVVKDVLIAVEGELYSRFAAGAAIDGAVIVDGVMLRADRELGWDQRSEVTIGAATVIAYSLAEPTWNATQDRHKSTVESLRDDQQGL